MEREETREDNGGRGGGATWSPCLLDLTKNDVPPSFHPSRVSLRYRAKKKKVRFDWRGPRGEREADFLVLRLGSAPRSDPFALAASGR